MRRDPSPACELDLMRRGDCRPPGPVRQPFRKCLMKSASWLSLIERIPPAQHDNLMLITATGLEIAVQSIIRTEEDYLVMRGRMSGSDNGRIIFLPFDRITYLGFQKNIKEAELRAMFGEIGAPPAPAEAKPEPEGAVPPPPPPPPPPPAAPPAAAPAPVPGTIVRNSGTRIPLPSKNAMLERLRARARAAARTPPESP